MTAKEFITEHYGQPTDDMEAEQQKEFAELMNEFARHIAELAIEEEKKVWCRTYERVFKDILTRIKKLIEE